MASASVSSCLVFALSFPLQFVETGNTSSVTSFSPSYRHTLFLNIHLQFFWHTWSLVFATADNDLGVDNSDVWGEEWRDGEEADANCGVSTSESAGVDFDDGPGLGSCNFWQLSPSSQGQRWKSSRPWFPFRRCRVQTCPSRNTGLQMWVQKWRAQHRPSEQSKDRRQGSPTWPGDALAKLIRFKQGNTIKTYIQFYV